MVEGPPRAGKSALLLTLAGRMRLVSGAVKVAGRVLPEQATVRRRTAVVDGADGDAPRAQLRSIEPASGSGLRRSCRRGDQHE